MRTIMLMGCKGMLRNFLICLMMFFVFSYKANARASFIAGTTVGCSPLTVQFVNTSTGAINYYWDMGNGNTSTLANPSNVYTSPGSYTVTLIAYDIMGVADTARYVNFITVVGQPIANFTVNANASCLDGNSYSFTNTSIGASTYLWDFGDGTTSTAQNPVHSYALSGVFTVSLIAYNNQNCQDIKIRNSLITIYPKPNATVISNSTSSCDPTTVFNFSNSSPNTTSYLWNFGDNTTSTSANPSHTYSSPGIYNVTLQLTNSYGCRDTSDSPVLIVIGNRNWANFSSNVDSGCPPLNVQFINTNANISSCLWNFGNGVQSTQVAPSYTYTTSGFYDVTLIVTTTNGCVDTVRKRNYIKIGQLPNVSFSYSTGIGCGPLTVQFTNTSTNFTNCQWWFGDGTISTAVNPTHTYTSPGTFSVTLKCWGPSGCDKSFGLRDIIKVTKTMAIFNASPRAGCPPLTTSFNTMTPGTGLTYSWNFGDGSTSNSANPSHTYTTTGQFDVTLIIRDTLGCTDTLHKPAYIQTINPTVAYIPPPTTVGCAPLTAQFTDATVGGTSWLWNFGDGTTSTLQNPVHTYSTPGFYTVSLSTTTAGGGCQQTISNFSSFQVNGGYAGFTHTVTPCPPYVGTFRDTSLNAVSWLWNFGDGTTSTAQNPTHNFIRPGYHSVSLTVTTGDGCSYTTMQSNSVYFTPFGANFYGMPMDTVYPLPVQFYANSLGATGWIWDFGDGTTSTLENPLHIYQYQDTFNVTLTITNGTCTLFYDPPPIQFGDPDTTPVDPGNPGLPVVQKGCAPLNVLFTKTIPGSSTWSWDFGDGATSNLQYPSHVYNTPGIYNVVLTTSDTLGIVQTLRMDSIVRVSGPTAGFIVSQTALCANTQITFIDSSRNAVSWQWNLGDGTTSTAQNPVHAYTSARPNYIITQTVTDTMGCTASLSTSVYSNFISPLIASETEVCGMQSVNFYTSLQNYNSYLWDFGDSTTSSQMLPAHTYTREGTYTVRLTVTDIAGCSQTFTLNPAITVNLPIADFGTISSRRGCNAINVQFQNLSQNAQTYIWDLGNGNISSLPNPIDRYLQAGAYTVSLTVFSGSCASTITKPQYIRVDTAYAEISVTPGQPCFPSLTQFTDLSVNPVSWKWFFGDGDTSMVQNPTHTYLDYPNTIPILVMTDINGCRDTARVSLPLFIKARFWPSAVTGCAPFSTSFTNNSSFSNLFFWDFGDGTTSTETNPTHTYTSAGSYPVTLIAGSTSADCFDTIRFNGLINVVQPISGFASTNRTACAPAVVTFNDLSTSADTYLWDFGDSTTSSNANPSHIYNTPGIYSVKLIVYSRYGCSDTLIIPNYVTAMGPITNFAASATVGCAPFTVQFTDQSTNAVTWSWNFGDGNSVSTTDAVHTYNDTGSFTVSLVTSDTAGCNSFYELPQKVIVHPSPTASFTSPSITGCEPFITSFTNNSTGHVSSEWYFGDGTNSSIENPSHEFLQSGFYDVQLIVNNSQGCTDTVSLPQRINVMPTPRPAITVYNRAGCSPLNSTFISNTTNIYGPQYFWDFGNGQTSTSQNPVFEYTTPGFYDISLIVTNSNGCSDTLAYPAYIQVYDTLPPNESQIYSVSVLNDTSVEIVWQNNPAIDLAGYVLYRFNRVAGMYEVIHTEMNPQNTNFSLTSSYVDRGLNTLNNTYTYKVQAIDICGYTIPLDQLTAHTTVNISSQRAGQNIAVSWTPYEGCGVNNYMLYRAGENEPFTYIATLPSSTLNYTDSTFTCPVPYRYKVVATDLCGNTYTSYSDTSRTVPLNILANQVVDVVRSTVIDNNYVLTEWKQPQVHPEMIAQYDVFRSTDNENFSYLSTVPSAQTYYEDHSTDVQNITYYYKILVINTCDIQQGMSPNTNSIVLKGEMDESRQVFLQWRPYISWPEGVDYYIIEKQDEDGHWHVLRQVSGDVLQYNYQE